MTLPLATEDDMVAARGEAVAEAERTAAAATASGALSSRELSVGPETAQPSSRVNPPVSPG